MGKPVLKEGIIGRIAQLIFLGKLPALRKRIKDDPALLRATNKFAKASQEYNKEIKKYEKKHGGKFKFPKNWNKLS